MKKQRILTSFIIAACAVIIPIQALPCPVPAVTAIAETSDTIEYSGMTFKIRQRNENELILPETIDGKTVTAIESKAFWENREIVNVTLPDTIDYFGYDVFAYSYVENINIPKSLKVIPAETFYRCTYLENVEFHDDIICIAETAFNYTYIEPDSSLICDGAGTSYSPFKKNYDEWELEISADENGNYSVKLIGYSPKSSYADLVVPDEYFGFPVYTVNLSSDKSYKFNSVEFPSGLSECSANCLKGHTELKNITFKSSDLTIGDNAFSNTGITELTLHGSAEIGKQAFYGCKDLKQITFDGEPEIITINESSFAECTSLEKVIIPESCKKIIIGKNAFQNTSIKEIEINGDCKIETDAFKYAPLKSITFNGNIETVLSSFGNCNKLETVKISDKSNFAANTFMNCTKIKNIDVNLSEKISGEAFNSCTNLMTVNGEQVFDSSTGDFVPKYKDFIMKSFNLSDDIGFINRYVQANVKKIVSENIADDMNDMQKVKALHDWVCQHTSYSPAGQESHNDAAILMNDTTVCEGYSRLCNLLYHEAGLGTYYATGVNHAWNIVNIDGHYFHIDSTWDDSSSSYEWFCKSDSEMKNAGGSHANWKTAVLSSLHEFQGNITPECPYSMGDMNTDGNINVADMVKLERYILNAEKPDSNLVLSDLNFDGVTDAFDMIEMRKKITNN